ncbi:MAG: tudor domain-containing protein [Parasphingorhabdus sp.]
MRFVAAIFAISILLGWSIPSAAETVIIKNNRGEKVKLCTYRSDDTSLIRSRKCWMLRKGQKINWNRGKESHAYDIRLFEPGAFELPICFRANISKSYLVKIAPRKTRSCITAAQRTTVPPQEWLAGALVLINRSGDNFWYPGTILQRIGDSYRVRFDDLRLETVKQDVIADLVLKGTRGLQVNWKRQGRWYPVNLKSVEDDQIRVIFEDGVEEYISLSLVRFDLAEQ